MIAMPNSHLILHKETLNNTLKNKISIKHLSKIINLGPKNCPVGRNGLIVDIDRIFLKTRPNWLSLFTFTIYLKRSCIALTGKILPTSQTEGRLCERRLNLTYMHLIQHFVMLPFVVRLPTALTGPNLQKFSTGKGRRELEGKGKCTDCN